MTDADTPDEPEESDDPTDVARRIIKDGVKLSTKSGLVVVRRDRERGGYL